MRAAAKKRHWAVAVAVALTLAGAPACQREEPAANGDGQFFWYGSFCRPTTPLTPSPGDGFDPGRLGGR